MPGLTPERLALLRKTLASKGLGLPQAAPIARRADRTVAPLSPAQERLWFLEAFAPGTALYNDAIAVDVQGPFDPARLRAALAVVAGRHEILRGTFEFGSNGARQRIAPAIDLPLVVQDLRGAAAPAAEAESHAVADARRPFALETELPWRVRLARVGEERWLLALTLHHIVSDGASCGILFDELGASYRGLPLPELAVQFGDYAAWERGRAAEPRAEADVDWWADHLSAPLADLAWPGARGGATHAGGLVPIEVDGVLAGRLADFARVHGVTGNHVLLTAWLVLLARTAGTTDVRTGTAASLRSRPELAGLIGFLVETQCLRADLRGDPDFATLVGRVREQALEASRHDRAPFDRVARKVAHAPLVQVFFSHMKDAIRAPDLAPARTTWRFLDPGVARFDLSLVLHETADGLTGFLEHDAGVLDAAAASGLARDYVALLESAIERPDARLSELAPDRPRATRDRTSLPIRPRRAIGG